MARRREPLPTLQDAQPGLKPGEDLPWREDVHARGGQLDRKRQPVEPVAERGDRRVLVRGRNELRPPLPCPLDEEATRFLGTERLELPHGFTAHPQGLAAGGDNPRLGAGGEQRGRKLGACGDDVLTVVEDEQQVAIRHVGAKRVGRCRFASGSDVECPGGLRGHVGSFGSEGEIDEPDAVGPPSGLTARELDREAGLSDAARAGDGHQAVLSQRLADPAQVLRTADQRRQWQGDVVRSGPPSMAPDEFIAMPVGGMSTTGRIGRLEMSQRPFRPAAQKPVGLAVPPARAGATRGSGRC